MSDLHAMEVTLSNLLRDQADAEAMETFYANKSTRIRIAVMELLHSMEARHDLPSPVVPSLMRPHTHSDVTKVVQDFCAKINGEPFKIKQVIGHAMRNGLKESSIPSLRNNIERLRRVGKLKKVEDGYQVNRNQV